MDYTLVSGFVRNCLGRNPTNVVESLCYEKGLVTFVYSSENIAVALYRNKEN